jgi:hypothetical protein
MSFKICSFAGWFGRTQCVWGNENILGEVLYRAIEKEIQEEAGPIPAG